jgi:hypothetical protein
MKPSDSANSANSANSSIGSNGSLALPHCHIPLGYGSGRVPPILHSGQRVNLAADCASWLQVGHRVEAGEFDRSDRSLLASFLVRLRSVSHPVCGSAKVRVESLLCHLKEACK